jgi:hypothetical protein
MTIVWSRSVLGHVANEVPPGGYPPTCVVSTYSGCYKGTARVDVSGKVGITWHAALRKLPGEHSSEGSDDGG